MNKLSASRIKTLSGCSWIYWAQYILKLPRDDNYGNIMGSCVHNVLEDLGEDRETYNELVAKQHIRDNENVMKRVKDYLDSKGVELEEIVPDKNKKPVKCIDLVEKMIIQGVNYDFYGESYFDCAPDIDVVEKEFDIPVDEDGKKYHILGFIDRLFLFKKEKTAIIRDFKSSKETFNDKELEDNIQDLMYRLALKHLYPEILTTKGEFVFLQFDHETDGVVRTPEVTDTEMVGFEYFLTCIQEAVDNFTIEDAKSNFAKNKGWPAKGEGFVGRAKCGRGESPTHKKVDGSIMWACPHKFAKYYWVLLDKEGKILSSKDLKKDLGRPKKGETVEKRAYFGCPAFAFLEYNKKKSAEFIKKGYKP